MTIYLDRLNESLKNPDKADALTLSDKMRSLVSPRCVYLSLDPVAKQRIEKTRAPHSPEHNLECDNEDEDEKEFWDKRFEPLQRDIQSRVFVIHASLDDADPFVDDLDTIDMLPLCAHNVTVRYMAHDTTQNTVNTHVYTRSPLASDNTPERLTEAMNDAIEIEALMAPTYAYDVDHIVIRYDDLLMDDVAFYRNLKKRRQS